MVMMQSPVSDCGQPESPSLSQPNSPPASTEPASHSPKTGCPVDLTRSMDNGGDTKPHAIRDTDKEAASKRLAFSVENILDPNKFNGKQHCASGGGGGGAVTPISGGIFGPKLNGTKLGGPALNGAAARRDPSYCTLHALAQYRRSIK
uniref:Uncharacterized protein n=1 Tax=Anopheles coluzzii TaxID=1518534 RepID=A0A8W7PGL6_ANOCL